MKAGRVLDRIVAQCIFRENPKAARPYSTDLFEAWQVADAIMGDEKFHFGLFAEDQSSWSCEFSKYTGVTGNDGDFFEACAETAPHAICLAALKAAGVTLAEETK